MLREMPIQTCGSQIRFLAHAKNLFLARNSTQQRIRNETSCLNMGLQKPWSSYDSGIYEYQHRCQHILKEGGFVNFIDKKTNVLALDAFSSISFIRELAKNTKNLKGGMSLSLVDFRSDEQREYDSLRNIFQLEESDLLRSKGWMGDVNGFLQRNGKEKFDLITCLPLGGWKIINEDGVEIKPPIDMLWTVTNTLWQLLADDGSMFIEYPYGYSTDVFHWIDQVQVTKKCSLEFSSNDESTVVRIDKNGSKLKQFPFI